MRRMFFEETRSQFLSMNGGDSCSIFVPMNQVFETICSGGIEKAIQNGFTHIGVCSKHSNEIVAVLKRKGIITPLNLTAYRHRGVKCGFVEFRFGEKYVRLDFIETSDEFRLWGHDYYVVELETIKPEIFKQVIAPSILRDHPPVTVIIRNNELIPLFLLAGRLIPRIGRSSPLALLPIELYRLLFKMLGNKF